MPRTVEGTFCPRVRNGRRRSAGLPPVLLRRMTHPPAPKASACAQVPASPCGRGRARLSAGAFFAVLHWRVSTPELHLNFGGTAQHSQAISPNHE